MKARITILTERIGGSYWFVPAVMAVAATLLAFGLVALDVRIGTNWIDRYAWAYANKPGGARALLAAIGGSMITVAGVVFSATLAAVTYATSQFGPRLLTNFMHDRANQVVLGTFTATFLYCLLVLRTIRSAEEDIGGAFVPHLAVFVGVLLAVASIGVLIFFVHHTPRSVHASHVAARIAKDLREGLATRYPARVGDAGVPALPPAHFRPDDAAPILAGASGYVQHVDPEAVLALAQKHGLVVYLPLSPGVFVSEGTLLAAATPAAGVNDDARDALRAAFVLGTERTPVQDLLFLVDELAEISARALSPGVNDPFTAITCLDWLFAAALDLSRRTDPSAQRFDAAGTLRVVARSVTFARFVAHAFDAVWPYVSQDRNAALHALHGLARMGAALDPQENLADRAEVRRLARDLHAQACDAQPHARPALDAALQDAERLLGTPALSDVVAVLARIT